MLKSKLLTRRHMLRGGAALIGMAGLAGCDRLASAPWFGELLASGEKLTQTVQRLMLSDNSLAREFTEADLSPAFRPNGSTNPDDEEYVRLAADNFAGWRLEVAGLVNTPLRLSLAELMAMPSRTQITRHDCVEGWSCIGKWKGVPLSQILQRAGLKPEARFIVLRCADKLEATLDGSGVYYESIDLIDAFHLQTILAYAMNDRPLPIAHGAPLRLRVERHLGYKNAKYVMRLEAVDSFRTIGGGKGGFWEDRGYEWYAGI